MFPVLKRITYEETPASVIEFIATKEAVHPMKSLEDLRTRLGPGRRVLALCHPLLTNEPLLFVHVALTDKVPSSMTQVMQVVPNDNPTCATFYSITNAQPGLAGIGLGEYLLKESVGVSVTSCRA
jgi:malonyl-CoA decarboxylase